MIPDKTKRMKTATKVICPNCGTSVEWSKRATWRPFCSERCKMVDLGAWANEDHAIPGNPASDDEAGQPWQRLERHQD